MTRNSDHRKPFALIYGSDEDTRLLLRTVLEIWNYEVAEAETPDDSVRIAASKRPDLVLMDLDLEFLESLSAMKRMQRSVTLNRSSFVVLSGHAQENVRRTAFAAGASAFLVKPVDFDFLENYLTTQVVTNHSALHLEAHNE